MVDQNEVLVDTVNMLSPLIMENYELKRKNQRRISQESTITGVIYQQKKGQKMTDGFVGIVMEH